MGGGGGFGFFGAGAAHDERQRDEQGDEEAQEPEGVDEAEDVGLLVELRGDLSQCAMSGFGGTDSGGF